MPVGVPTAGADQREVRPDPCCELGRLVRRAVVGDLHHVDLRKRTCTGGHGEEAGLSRWLEVTERQDRDCSHHQVEDDAGVVGRVLATAEVPGRPENPPAHGARVARPGQCGRRRDLHRYACVVEQVAGAGGLPGRLGDRADQRLGHLPTPEHGAQPTDVVRVVVAQHQEVDAVDAETTEAGIRGAAVRADVDDHGTSRTGPQHQGVALADVARDHGPVAREAAGARGRDAQRADHRHDGEEQDHHRARSPRRAGRRDALPHRRERAREPSRKPRPTEQDHEDRRRHDGEADGAPGAARPGQPCARKTGHGARDGRDPPDGAARARREDGRDSGEPGREDRRSDTEEGRRQQRRRCEKVRRHRVEGDRGVEEHQDRPARGLRHQRYGDQARQHGPAPGHRLEAPCGRRSEQHDGRGGDHAQHEPVVARDPRVDHDQHDHGTREGGHGAGRPPQQHPEDAHRTHHRGADHGRPGVDQQDEAAHRHREEDRRGPAPQPDRTAEPADREPEDGEVPAGDGRDVREAGRPHRLLEVGWDPRGVTDRGARHEAAQVRREVVGHLQEGRPHPPGDRADAGRWTELGRRSPAVQQRDRTLAVRRRRERSPDLDDGAVPHVVAGRTQDDHLSHDAGRGPGPVQRGDHPGRDDRPAAAAPERHRSADDLTDQDDGGTVLRERPEDSAVPGRETGEERPGDREDHHEDEHRGRGTRSRAVAHPATATRTTVLRTTATDGRGEDDAEKPAAQDSDDDGDVARRPADEDRPTAPGGHGRRDEAQVEALVAGLRRGHGGGGPRAATARSR